MKKEGPRIIKECQAIIGELQWLATRTRPDLCSSTSLVARMIDRRPAYALGLCNHMLRYLAEHQTYGLRYEQDTEENILHVRADTSFAPPHEQFSLGAGSSSISRKSSSIMDIFKTSVKKIDGIQQDYMHQVALVLATAGATLVLDASNQHLGMLMLMCSMVVKWWEGRKTIKSQWAVKKTQWATKARMKIPKQESIRTPWRF